MECGVCGTADELLYACDRCGEQFCATHHGGRYHRCRTRRAVVHHPGPRPRSRDEPAVDRPEAQVYSDAPAATTRRQDRDGAADSDDREAWPDRDAVRPGYEPDRRPPSAGPPTTVGEWLRQQTYLSLTVKVGLVAALCSVLVFAAIVLALYGPFA